MITKEQKYNNLYMNFAELSAQMSYANRLKVGCVAVRDDNILSFSWNGTLPTRPNCCEYTNDSGDLVTSEEVIHAEENCILKAAKHGVSLYGATLYITHSPCIRCARMIIASGIKKVIYKYEYKPSSVMNIDPTSLLNGCGVEIERID